MDARSFWNGPRPRAEAGAHPGGFVLAAVLWILAMLSVLSAAFAFRARTEVMVTRLGLEQDRDYWTARAGAHRTAALIRKHARDPVHQVTDAWFSDPQNYDRVAFGQGTYSVVRSLPKLDLGLTTQDLGFGLDDEESRINVNVATPEMLMAVPGVTQVLAEGVLYYVVQAKQKQRQAEANQAATPDDEHPTTDADRLVDGPVRDLEELMQVPGMTRAVLYGLGPDTPGLADLLTCFSSGLVNVNTARPLALAGLGLDDGQVNTVLATRRPGGAGFASVDDFLSFVGVTAQHPLRGGGMLDVVSRNFLIDCRAGGASGRAGTGVKARLTLFSDRMRFTSWRTTRLEPEAQAAQAR